MKLLDAWEAPEPSPYFLTRLGARMREEREAAPAGWFAGAIARLRASVAYGPGLHVRPLAAMALTVMLLVGGGAYLGVTDWMQPARSRQARALPWCTICRRSIAMRKCWIRWKLSPANQSGD